MDVRGSEKPRTKLYFRGYLGSSQDYAYTGTVAHLCFDVTLTLGDGSLASALCQDLVRTGVEEQQLHKRSSKTATAFATWKGRSSLSGW